MIFINPQLEGKNYNNSQALVTAEEQFNIKPQQLKEAGKD